MKINEKTLIRFSTSSTPSDREGWLYKRGEVNKSFQRRWFVLKGNLLFYFEKQGDKEPIGVIILEGCTIELAEEETEVFAFKVMFHSGGRPGRVYTLGSQTQDDMEAWMKLLACSSYDYMKLMVVELQQQLAELEENERQAAAQRGAEDDRQPPKAPPRTNRHNPFNDAGHATGRGPSKRRWAELHAQHGVKILADRAVWREAKEASHTIEMKDDQLLVTV